jgi:TfoX/Sxy family transcriptional regulator of competence genes
VAYDERLAARVRAVLKRGRGLTERRMFGGLAFLLNGHMACGVLGDTLVLRLGAEGAKRALARLHTRPMDFTGRALASMVYVEPAGHRRDADLRAWLARAVRFARALPAK